MAARSVRLAHQPAHFISLLNSQAAAVGTQRFCVPDLLLPLLLHIMQIPDSVGAASHGIQPENSLREFHVGKRELFTSQSLS